ncbi:MAG TPA: hypothetical protein VN809_05425 [Telmatospirillum sp.]|nr:hypothetical protein [Telmatospirillum sp.]
MSGWGCPHEIMGVCQRLNGLQCDPGRKGCVLHGRFRFSDETKNPEPSVAGANTVAEPPAHQEDD